MGGRVSGGGREYGREGKWGRMVGGGKWGRGREGKWEVGWEGG